MLPYPLLKTQNIPHRTLPRALGCASTQETHLLQLIQPCPLLCGRLHGSGQIFARTKTSTVPPCVYTGPAELDEFLNVQVWDLKKAGQLFDRHGSIFVRTRVNTRTVQLFAQIARLWPGVKCRNWSKLCTDPCKHHCNRICTDPARIHVNRLSRNKIRPCKNLSGLV